LFLYQCQKNALVCHSSTLSFHKRVYEPFQEFSTILTAKFRKQACVPHFFLKKSVCIIFKFRISFVYPCLIVNKYSFTSFVFKRSSTSFVFKLSFTSFIFKLTYVHLRVPYSFSKIVQSDWMLYLFEYDFWLDVFTSTNLITTRQYGSFNSLKIM
jgi:hypothetical protein